MEKFYLGVGRRIITPEVGGNLFGYSPDVYSESVYDDLTATVFAFCQGDERAILVSINVGNIQTELSDEIRNGLGKKYNVKFENIILSATHTHSGPNTVGMYGWGDVDREYCDSIFIPQIFAAADEAFGSLTPVKVGTATGESLIGVNRRAFVENNQIWFGEKPWGCVDTKMTIISFRNEDGKTIANMVHYGVHGTTAGLNHEITRDLTGGLVDRLDELTGGITAFFNGTEGDVSPRCSLCQSWGMEGLVKMREICAKDAERIYNMISEYKNATLECTSGVLRIPNKTRISQEEAVAGLEGLENQTVNVDGRMAKYYSDVIESYKNGYEEKDAVEIPQSVISFADNVFVNFPYEMFSEIGLRIQSHFMDRNVLSLSNANGTGGYIPTQDQICLGGYEVKMFKTIGIQAMVDDADWHFISETVENIKKLKGDK